MPNKHLTIAIDIRSLMEGKRTGVEEYVINVLHALFRIDSDNHYILFYNSMRDVSAHIPQFDYPNVRIRSFRFPNKLFNASLLFLRFPKLDRLIGDIDLYFSPNLRLSPLGSRVKKVTTIHDLSFVLYPECFSLKRRLWHRAMHPRREISSSDALIAVSQSTKRHVMYQYAVDSSRVHVIHSGKNHDDFADLRPHDVVRLRETYHLPERFFLFIGTVEPRKNLDTLLLAYAEYFASRKSSGKPAIDLVVAGAQGWLSDHISSTIANLGIGDRVHVIGYVAHEDKSLLYQMAHCFIYPSLFEGFGFPPLESYVQHTPVITSSTSSLPEIMRGNALLVDPYNTGDIARALALASSLPKEEMFAALNHENLDDFSWERAARATKLLFEDVGARV
jgi:glycosyltransferase involved in cell wall biosynthesis